MDKDVPFLTCIYSHSYFGLKVPENQGLVGKGRLRLARTFSLGEYMQENKETWHQMVKKYNLDPKAFDFATWAFVGK